MSDEAWYRAGLRFECTQCGNCCRTHGEYAYIYLMDADVDALAAHLSLSREAFLSAHTVQDGGWTMVRTDAPQCPFLDEDSRCRVYEARPVQCRTWPFWDENLKRPTTWNGPVRETCPGIGRGRLYGAEEIERIVRSNQEWYEADE